MTQSGEPSAGPAAPSPPPLPAVGARSRGWLIWALCSVAVLILSFVLDPDRPTGNLEICPMKHFTGWPCPGCGITRSLIRCSRGRFAQAIHYHPLGPLVWLATILCASNLVWPRTFRERVAELHRRHHKSITEIVLVFTAFLAVFGILRIVFLYVTPWPWWPW